MSSQGPLAGVRVLDFSRFMQGPLAAGLLCDMGAEVIKVEVPEVGELGRRVSADADGFSPFFECLNRGKRSLTVDLRSEGGIEIVHRLIERSDVLVENFTPGVMERLGLAYEDVKALNPSVIYASGSGYGHRGPNRAAPMFDNIGQGVAGLMDYSAPYMNGEPHTTFGIADPSGGVFLALGIVTALYERQQSGLGQHVGASLVGSCIALERLFVTASLRHEKVKYPRRRGHSTSGQFLCKDGKWLVLSASDQPQWLALCKVMDRLDLAEDHRFRHGRARTEAYEVLEPIMEAEFLKRDRDEWIELIRAAHIPVGPINSYVDLIHDEDVLANEYVLQRSHPRWGNYWVVGSPISFDRTPVEIATVAPDLGADSADILADLGYTADEVAELVISNVI